LADTHALQFGALSLKNIRFEFSPDPRARPRAGHPRLSCHGAGLPEGVDDRDKPGHRAIFSWPGRAPAAGNLWFRNLRF